MKKLAALFLSLGVFTIQAQVDSSVIDSSAILTQKSSDLNLVSLDALDTELEGQDVSGLLQSSRDPLVSAAAFNFNGLWYRLRGLNSDQQTVLLNGVHMNDPVSGFGLWSVWSGLNDITRYQYSVLGIGSYDLQFGGVRGATNINTRASDQRKGTRITYSATNRSYRHRLIATHNTGVLESGWAFSFSASLRYADEGYAEGTYYNGLSYFASADKKINEKHAVGFTALGAPTVQGLQGMVVQEVYDLTGNNYYNPYWGYQNGKKRNYRERFRHQPLLMATHYMNLNEGTKLNTSVYSLFGTNSRTNINWADAKDPRTDYYRYLPSFYNEPSAEDIAQNAQLTSLWQNDDSYRQVNWDDMYFANSKNLYQVENADGIAGNTVVGNRSKYMLEDVHQDPLVFGLNSNIKHKIDNISNISATISYRNHTTHYYREVEDLLGGDFWLDVDQFSEQDFSDPQVAQNDINTLNNVVYVGEKQGFNYKINVSNVQAFSNYEISLPKVDFYAAAKLGYQTFYREGLMRNGRFPANSFGKSEIQGFLHYGLKAGATYKITGNQFLKANLAYMQNAPNARNAFLNAWNNNEVTTGLDQIEVRSADINYYFKSPSLKARLTGYYIEMNNLVDVRTYYHDEFRNFVNYSMSGVNTLNYGVELGFDYNISPSVQATAIFASGDYLYNSRPQADITVNNSAEKLDEGRVVYLKNYHVGGTPEVIASLGLKYNSSKFWWAGINASYFDEYYITPNPDRRTAEAVDGLLVDDAPFQDIISQQQLDPGFLLNAVAGKSFKVGYRKYLNLILSVNNILNNTDIQSFAYEQLRYDSDDIARFPNRFRYLNGLSYFLMVRYRF